MASNIILFILVTIFARGATQSCCISHLFVGKIQARCCIPKPINCYNCDSSYDVRCKDPFNRSALPHEHPPVMHCGGWCVKWVLNSRTSKEIVRRTCISQFQVNWFMVDTACLQEKSKAGHLCFCEDELCNKSITLMFSVILYVIILLFHYLL